MKTIICITLLLFAASAGAWTEPFSKRMFNGTVWDAFKAQKFSGYNIYQPGSENRSISRETSEVESVSSQGMRDDGQTRAPDGVESGPGIGVDGQTTGADSGVGGSGRSDGDGQ